MSAHNLEQVANLAKRRGFIFPSAEIYGGAGSIYDLGPLGAELNNNLKKIWWQRFIYDRDDMVGLDSAILTPQAVLKASGHVDGFSDPLIECEKCHVRLRADHYQEESNPEVWQIRWRDEAMKQRGIGETKALKEAEEATNKYFHEQIFICPKCGEQNSYGEPRQFNMMFSTHLGATEEEGSVAYLRPETAQGIFTNFKLVAEVARKKLPFGIGQIGKAFRNEITTGNSLFRVREFEQAEIEYFVKPGEDESAHDEWINAMESFLINDLGIKKENLRRFEHPKESLSHYSKRTVDFEYNFPFGGWGELMGVANRTDFDLKQHAEYSKQDLTYFDENTREKFIPYVIEPSIGLGRAMLTVLIDSFMEYPNGRDGQGSETEIVLHLPKELAPVQVAVLPLMKKDGLAEKAKEVASQLRETHGNVQYDESGAIGRRYRRQDEIGTPICVTIDYQTLEDGTVTVRDRDTMEQKRVKIEEL